MLKFLLLLIIIPGIVLLGFSCSLMFGKMLTHAGIMNMDEMTAQGKQDCCTTNISHHFDYQKNTLAVLPPKLNYELIFLSVALMLFFGFVARIFKYHSSSLKTPRSYLYNWQNPDSLLFDRFRVAFAKGIINPKIH